MPSFRKLSNGEWGVGHTAPLAIGAVTVTKRDGTTSAVVISHQVWTDGKTYLYAIEAKPAQPRGYTKSNYTRKSSSYTQARSSYTPDPEPALAAGQQRIVSSRPYSVGRVVTIKGLPGHWTVVHQGGYRISEGQDDTREGEYEAWAHARPATEDEAAPVIAAKAKAERKAELIRLVTETDVKNPDGTWREGQSDCPPGAVLVWRSAPHGTADLIVRTPDNAHWHNRSLYDDYRECWRKLPTDPALIDELIALSVKP